MIKIQTSNNYSIFQKLNFPAITSMLDFEGLRAASGEQFFHRGRFWRGSCEQQVETEGPNISDPVFPVSILFIRLRFLFKAFRVYIVYIYAH